MQKRNKQTKKKKKKKDKTNYHHECNKRKHTRSPFFLFIQQPIDLYIHIPQFQQCF